MRRVFTGGAKMADVGARVAVRRRWPLRLPDFPRIEASTFGPSGDAHIPSEHAPHSPTTPGSRPAALLCPDLQRRAHHIASHHAPCPPPPPPPSPRPPRPPPPRPRGFDSVARGGGGERRLAALEERLGGADLRRKVLVQIERLSEPMRRVWSAVGHSRLSRTRSRSAKLSTRRSHRVNFGLRVAQSRPFSRNCVPSVGIRRCGSL